jgi:hypothetical protein
MVNKPSDGLPCLRGFMRMLHCCVAGSQVRGGRLSWRCASRLWHMELQGCGTWSCRAGRCCGQCMSASSGTGLQMCPRPNNDYGHPVYGIDAGSFSLYHSTTHPGSSEARLASRQCCCCCCLFDWCRQSLFFSCSALWSALPAALHGPKRDVQGGMQGGAARLAVCPVPAAAMHACNNSMYSFTVLSLMLRWRMSSSAAAAGAAAAGPGWAARGRGRAEGACAGQAASPLGIARVLPCCQGPKIATLPCVSWQSAPRLLSGMLLCCCLLGCPAWLPHGAAHLPHGLCSAGGAAGPGAVLWARCIAPCIGLGTHRRCWQRDAIC